MRHAVALGARLAWHGRGGARLRSALVALAALVGTTVLLSAAGLVTADAAAQPSRYADRGFIWLAMALVMGVAVPVLVLAATVGRLSAGLRAQRLASLRLLGLSAARTRVVAMVETGLAAAVGALAALAVAWALRPALTLVPVWGETYPAGAIAPPALLTLAVVLVVPLVVVAVASLPERLSRTRVLSGVRRAETRRPSAWRLVPLALGIVWCLGFARLVSTAHLDDAVVVTVNLVGSVTTLGIGVLLVVPVLVRLVGDVLLRLGRSPASRIAARRIQAQPATMTRVVSGLLLGLFVVTGARCVVVAFETTPQYVGSAHHVEVQQRATIYSDTADLDDAGAEVRTLPGVRQVLPLPTGTSTDCQDGYCARAAVLDCAEVALLAPGVTGCRDDEPMWTGAPIEPVPSRWRAVRGGEVQLPAPVEALGGGTLPLWQTIDAEVVVPPATPGADRLQVATAAAVVLADPGRDLLEQIDATSVGSYGSWGADDYDQVVTLRALVWSIGALVVSLGLLSFGIAAVDRAVERRREVATLQVVGVPAGVLRRAQWIEVAAPLVVGSVLAVTAGLSAGATYLTMDPAARLPWSASATLATLGVAGGVLLAGLTVVAASPRLRPELIRAE